MAVFQTLAALHAFTWPYALLAWGLIASSAHAIAGPSPNVLAVLGQDLCRISAVLRSLLLGRYACLTWLASGLVLTTLARAFITPPLNWDALTYHLVTVGNWVQSGGFFTLEGPDAWSYYHYFPAGGDIVPAWLMLSFGGDLLVNLTNLPLWSLAALSVYALSRTFYLSASNAGLAAAVVAFLPATYFELRSPLVDIGLLAELILGTLFLIRARRSKSVNDGILACLAFGCAAGTKISALPPALIAVAFGAFASLHRLTWADRGRLLLAPVLGFSVAIYWYARAWIQKGSPFYPYPVRVFGHEVFEGNVAFTRLLSGANEKVDALHLGIWEQLGHYATLAMPHFSTFGPMLLLVLVLAPWGALKLFRSERKFEAILLVIMTTSLLVSFFSEELRGMRHFWLPVTGRFLAFGFALLLVLAFVAIDSVKRWNSIIKAFVALAIIVQLYVNIPVDWQPLIKEDPMLILKWSVISIAVGGSAVLGLSVVTSRPQRSSLAGVLCAALFLLALPPLSTLRADYRSHCYKTLRDQDNSWFRVGQRAWEFCEKSDSPLKIAFAAGYDGVGHNWLWSPLLGSRLQNKLEYVPIARDGSVIDYAELVENDPRIDFDSWLGRLLDKNIDVVVLFPKETPELGWVLQHQELFSRNVMMRRGGVFTIQRANASAYLQR